MADVAANEMVGRLTLADSMLGEVAHDLLRIIAYAEWPEEAREPAPGMTTRQTVDRLEKRLEAQAALAAQGLLDWIADVQAVTGRRDRVVHAIALDQCINCGKVTMFRHPRSGEDVDRSTDALAEIEREYEELRKRGLPLAKELADAVNRRIENQARAIANETDEIQNPVTVSPHDVEHWCAECAGGVSQTFVRLGTALAVIPPKRWKHYLEGRWPIDRHKPEQG